MKDKKNEEIILTFDSSWCEDRALLNTIFAKNEEEYKLALEKYIKLRVYNKLQQNESKNKKNR